MIPFSKLFSWFSPEVIEDHKSAPAIQGVFSAETRERGTGSGVFSRFLQ